MGIPETQLDTWAKQGSVTQSADTYKTIKGVIESNDAPYAGKAISPFLQGSYGNDTNVYGRESDVDIVLLCTSVFYSDTSSLTAPEKALYEEKRSKAAYQFADYKRDVNTWLGKKFGSDAVPGKKATRIRASGNRREADVLPCMEFRRYLRFNGDFGEGYVEGGVCFFLADGTRVTNYPMIHRDNVTAKHQATNYYFKPMVRILKNMRNRMKEDGLISGGIAPSYYLEGLLYNVPDELFGTSYERTFLQCYSYLQNADRAKLVCANRQAWLLRKGEHTSWDTDDFKAFFDALADFWNNWS